MAKLRTKKRTTLIHFILDKSGSMDSIKKATISGFNEYLQSLKKSKEKINFSLTLFDSISIDTPYINVSVKQVETLSSKTYRPNGGTPLYDAVVESVEALHEKVKEQDIAIVVAIMTDGEENSSKTHDEKCMRDLVEKLQSKGNWTFTYMGANQDAWGNAAKMGISRGNTMDWSADDEGSKDAFKRYALSSANYVAMASNAPSDALHTRGFFSKEDES